MINSNDLIRIGGTLGSDEPLYGTTEVAKILGFTRQAITNYVRCEKIIPDACIGGRFFFTIDTITRIVLQVILKVGTKDVRLYNEIYRKQRETLQLIADSITKEHEDP